MTQNDSDLCMFHTESLLLRGRREHFIPDNSTEMSPISCSRCTFPEKYHYWVDHAMAKSTLRVPRGLGQYQG
jgi:hypothetical protein